MTDRLLSAEEVADRVGCSVRTVRRWIAEGVIASVKIGGLRRVRERELDRLVGIERTDWGAVVDVDDGASRGPTSPADGGSDD